MSAESSSRYWSARSCELDVIRQKYLSALPPAASAGRWSNHLGMSIARVAWITVAGICAIAALLLLVNGYDGYSAVLLFIGLSAAVNLLP
jgi:hypothetical protein